LRVLYIATSFPEPDKGATIYTDLAEALCETGHELGHKPDFKRKINMGSAYVTLKRLLAELRILGVLKMHNS